MINFEHAMESCGTECMFTFLNIIIDSAVFHILKSHAFQHIIRKYIFILIVKKIHCLKVPTASVFLTHQSPT